MRGAIPPHHIYFHGVGRDKFIILKRVMRVQGFGEQAQNIQNVLNNVGNSFNVKETQNKKNLNINCI
jgi:hypothetical protein